MYKYLIMPALIMFFGSALARAEVGENCSRENLNKIGMIVLDVDQSNRFAHIELYRKDWATEAEKELALKKQSAIIVESDKLNQQRLAKLLDTCGLPEGAWDSNFYLQAVFFVVIHAPLEYESKYYGLLKAANARNDLRDSDLELLDKRISFHLSNVK